MRHCRQIFVLIIEGWIKPGTPSPITPRAMGMTLTIAAILIIGPLSKILPRLIEIIIPLVCLATGHLSHPPTSEHTLVIELDSSISGLCLKDLNQDSISYKLFPGCKFGLRVLGFIVRLLGVVVFSPDMLEIPGYTGSIEDAVNLNTSLEALEQSGSHTINWQTLDV